MTIAVNPGLAFDIETYDGLIAFVTAKLELDATTVTQLPTLLRIAESRIDRLLIYAERETTESVATVADNQTVALPTTYRHLRGIRLVANPGYQLQPVTYDVLHDEYSNKSGVPTVYTINAGQIHLGPIPDAAYTLSVSYTEKLPNLTEANQSNWLLQENPDVYVNALCYETLKWLEDLDAAQLYFTEFMNVINESNVQANRYRNTVPMRLRSSVVV